jgi:hypothetical protein
MIIIIVHTIIATIHTWEERRWLGKEKRRGETRIMIEFGDNLSFMTYLTTI